MTRSTRSEAQPRHKPRLPDPAPKASAPTVESVPAATVDRIRDLDARGYLSTQIAAQVRLPYAVVEAVLKHKPKPRKPAGGPKT